MESTETYVVSYLPAFEDAVIAEGVTRREAGHAILSHRGQYRMVADEDGDVWWSLQHRSSDRVDWDTTTVYVCADDEDEAYQLACEDVVDHPGWSDYEVQTGLDYGIDQLVDAAQDGPSTDDELLRAVEGCETVHEAASAIISAMANELASAADTIAGNGRDQVSRGTLPEVVGHVKWCADAFGVLSELEEEGLGCVDTLWAVAILTTGGDAAEVRREWARLESSPAA